MALVVFLRGVNVGGHRTFRPTKLADFTGQPKLKENLSIAIEAAKQREEAMDHVDGTETEVDFASGGKDEDAGDDVVAAARVARVEAEGISFSGVD